MGGEMGEKCAEGLISVECQLLDCQELLTVRLKKRPYAICHTKLRPAYASNTEFLQQAVQL